MESFSFQLNKLLYYYLLENNEAQRADSRIAFSLIHFFVSERIDVFTILGSPNKQEKNLLRNENTKH